MEIKLREEGMRIFVELEIWSGWERSREEGMGSWGGLGCCDCGGIGNVVSFEL
jgi:hypothetical protein